MWVGGARRGRKNCYRELLLSWQMDSVLFLKVHLHLATLNEKVPRTIPCFLKKNEDFEGGDQLKKNFSWDQYIFVWSEVNDITIMTVSKIGFLKRHGETKFCIHFIAMYKSSVKSNFQICQIKFYK